MIDDQVVLKSRFLCTAEFEVASGLQSIGASPFGEQRMGFITGGRVSGPHINGKILNGGGNWSRAGQLSDGRHVGTFDARTLWELDDGALVHINYGGRSVLSDAVRQSFADPAQEDADPSQYYLRIAPQFETASSRYEWLNGILAIGVGERTSFGVRHQIYEIL